MSDYIIPKDEYTQQGLQKIEEVGLLSKDNLSAIQEISKDLLETWKTERIWRTETEMRYSVLNDVKHPTRGMKYLQARREQEVFLKNLMYLACDYEEEQGKLMVLEAELEELEGTPPRKITKKLEGEIKQKKAQIKRTQWHLMEMQKQGHHRVRELLSWEKIKRELNDGSFDPNDYEGIQLEGLPKRWRRELELNYANISANTGSLEAIKDVDKKKDISK